MLAAAGFACAAWGETRAVPVAPEVTAAMRRGFDWMQAHQKENGSWSSENFPALTALGLWAFAEGDHASRSSVCARAAAFVAGFVQEDGGIYKVASGGRGSGGLAVYNTAICMTALHAYDRHRYAPIILKARAFLADAQFRGEASGSSAGGFGYERAAPGPRSRADLSNTGWALTAMHATQDMEDLRPRTERRVDVDWAAAIAFAARLQNQDAADQENFGGFGYENSGDRGGVTTNRVAGTPTLRGYGSMTYAGLESMLYAQVGRDDPRVRSAIDWAVRHWSVTENPGQGLKGLFYYYAIMAKTLPLMGSGDLASGGKTIAWRRDLTAQLLKIQQADGSWANTDNTFWENDPSLVTAYALLTIEKCLVK
jgi:squalene-hopene/tetraprenyl-beta-curcumene cyclase